MAPWKGLDMNCKTTGIPHVTCIPRKPKGIGTEFKSLADGKSGVMLKLEIQEGKAAMATKEYSNLPVGTGTTLRLCKKYFNSNRTVVADSWFSSVPLLSNLRQRKLHLVGIVKTATKRFPIQWLRQQDNNLNNGEHSLAVAKTPDIDADEDMYALAWKIDHKISTLIASRGTTTTINAAKRKRHRVELIDNELVDTITEYEVNRPHIAEIYYSYYNAVDVHDHLRQGSLSMETTWKTRKWVHRIFATVFGMIITDCYLAYAYENKIFSDKNDNIASCFYKFVDKLANQLIKNTIESNQVSLRSSSSSSVSF